MNKPRTIIVLLLFVFSFTFPRPIYASCIGPLSVNEYKEDADVVVIGTVNGLQNGTANFLVEKYFKGSGEKEIKVSGSESSVKGVVTSVDYTFSDGERYLLFLNQTDSDVLKTNLCMGNRIIENELSSEEIDALGTGISPELLPPLVSQDKNTLLIVSFFIVSSGALLFFLNRLKKKR